MKNFSLKNNIYLEYKNVSVSNIKDCNLMQKIIISISELSSSNWNLIYRFIDGFYKRTLEKNVFDKLNSKPNAITIAKNSLDKDPYSAYGEKLLYNYLPPLDKTTFSVIFIKMDDKEDFSDLVPFFLLKNKFREKITLGIDVGNISLEKSKQKEFIFKCSDFFRFIEDKKPQLGNKSIYFINVKSVDKTTGEIRNFSNDNVTSLIGKGKTTNSSNESEEKKLKASRKYLPLLKIDEDKFLEFFGDKSPFSEEAKYMLESTINLSQELSKKKFPIDEIPYHSIFEEWLTKAYFNSVGLTFDKIGKIEYEGLKNVLHSYCNNIYELVQNIIFHGGKNGLLYFVFNKKENISNNQKIFIPFFNKYDDLNQRFLEIGIFDYNPQGIVNNYIEKYDPENRFVLENFFDTKFIHSTGLSTHLELRYTAHLGIKSFVKSVISHNGYFRVESNSNNQKEFVESVIDKSESFKYNLNSGRVDFTDGTHYKIILPVKNFSTTNLKLNQIQTQKKSFADKLKNRLDTNKMSIKHIRLYDIIVQNCNLKTTETHSKNEQIEYIKTIGNEILSTIGQDNISDNEISIDLSGFNHDVNFIFKLLSYIQLTHINTFEKIILTHLSDNYINEFCDLIQKFLIDLSIIPIWSRNSAIILVSNDLHYQIICGETTDELNYLNSEFEKYYFPRENYFKQISINNYKKLADKFILPYEVLIEDNNHTFFEQFILNILKESIESEKMGYSVCHENTYIGSKLIIRNFYEADSMFQNSFFAERFAYLISRSIFQTECLKVGVYHNEYVALVGYKSYSEILVKAIKKLIPKHIKTVIIANEEKDGEGIIFEFDKSKNNNGELIEELITQNPNSFKFITIVPIGSTLSTNDKINAFLRLHIKRENKSELTLPLVNFIYNHCAIVVRDKVGFELTPMELRQKWEKISEKKIIKTSFKNANTVYFSIQVGAKADNTLNWLARLNSEVSFPIKWQDEQYVNFTENSINSQNLMGYPKVNKSHKEDKYNHEIELDRLYEIKENIYSGHIECLKSHYSYYIDTETYIKRKDKKEFINWKEQISKSKVFDNDDFNVLITPNAKLQSDFIETINYEIFGGNALIIYLDVSNWRNNIIHKLSYLRLLRNTSQKDKIIKFHYVDHALLTSETYRKVKSYMYSILQDNDYEEKSNFHNFTFTSIITLINRLSYDRDIEIRKDVNHNLFAFLNLFIPPSKDPERDCSLCILSKHYDRIRKNTVIERCNNVILNNINKIKIRTFNKISESSLENTEASKYTDEPPEVINDRKFIRMMLTHEIFYIISNITSDIDIDNKNAIIKNELNKLYHGITLSRLDKWYNTEKTTDLFKTDKIDCFLDNKFKIDKEISFLKVISSPPLSQYIIIRSFANEKLLEILASILPKRDFDNNLVLEKGKRYKYDDLRKLKAILKSLSFLKSNALVRKDVIIGAWIICYKVMSQIAQEIDELNELKSIIKDFKVIQGELNSDKNNKRISTLNNTFNKELDTLNKGIDTLILDFKSDFQFFIKNAIFEDEAKSLYLGELLRTGDEISDFSNIIISKTLLFVQKCNSKNNNKKNSLFEYNFSSFEINKKYKKEYTDFLVWLFYDNTTIIRKTLQNFENELVKDKSFEEYFFYKSNDIKLLNNFEDFTIKINKEIKLYNSFKEKVENEYYYSMFKNYLKNLDGFEFIKKLIFVIYAKFKLKDLIENKHKSDVETDIKSLLEIFSAIMDADASLFAMKKEKEDNEIESKTLIYPVSLYGKIGNKRLENWDYDNWFFDDQFYSAEVLKQNDEKYKSFAFPIIIRYNLTHLENDKPLVFGEKEELSATHLNILLIDNPNPQFATNPNYNKTDLISTITFLYEKKNGRKEKDFRIHIQESGRLLLLLKSEINKYIIDYLKDEKVFDLWVEERKRYELYKLPDHNYYNNLAELKLAIEHNVKDKIDWLYSMVFNKIKLRNYLIGADISTLNVSNLNVKNEIKKYCKNIFDSFLIEFVKYDIDENMNFEFSEVIFKEIFSEYLLNIKRVLCNGLASICEKETEIIITVKENIDNIEFCIVNDFFVSKDTEKIINEISTHGHINGAKREKGLSFNERLLEKVGSKKPIIEPIVINKEKALGQFKVIFNLKK